MQMLRTTLFAAAFVAATVPATLAGAATEKTSISLPATTVTFMPVYLAKELGYWDKLGLDVTIHNISGIGTTNAMLAGSVDFAVQSGPSLLRGNMRGQKMLGIALMADGVAFELETTKKIAGNLTMKAPFKQRIMAIKGKSVSVDSPKTVVEGFLRYITSKAGLDPDRDFTMTYMQPPSAIAGVVGGSLDAAVLNFPWTFTAQRQGAVKIASGLSDVPELLPTAATTTTTRPDFCKEHHSICVKLVQGYIKSHAFLLDHPDKATDVAVKIMPKANRDDIQKSLVALAKTTPRIPEYKEAYFKHVQQLMLVGGMIKKDEAWDEAKFKGIFTNEYVDEAAKSGS
jgi:ABC-type nitrate/sulfonate/bicarbonate transport system substrate-binding protein